MVDRNVFVEFHALTSHSPSNLNRDDLGSPKTAIFGGHRRLRISSQCLKRTWRLSPYFRGEFAEEQLGIRTRRLPHQLREELLAASVPPDVVDGMMAVFATLGRKAKDVDDEEDEASEAVEGEETASVGAEDTAHLLYVSRQEIEEMKAFVKAKERELASLFVTKAGKGGKGSKRAAKPEETEKLRKALQAHLREKCERNAVDVALFGRFVTGEEFRTEAALQVAHALGTQKVELEYDYFSAVDDLGSSPGAGHIGEAEFGSAVFYKYAVCDLSQLRRNLAGDGALAARALKAVAQAMARSVPIGKKNSTAPQNPADYLEVVVRRDAPVSLANAFLKPVEPERDKGVMERSIRCLREHAKRYDRAYGADLLGRFVLSPIHEVIEEGFSLAPTLAELAGKLESVVANQKDA